MRQKRKKADGTLSCSERSTSQSTGEVGLEGRPDFQSRTQPLAPLYMTSELTCQPRLESNRACTAVQPSCLVMSCHNTPAHLRKYGRVLTEKERKWTAHGLQKK